MLLYLGSPPVMPSVSKRISIAWDGGEPFEDTDTLVIVGNNYFVDVRVKKDTGGLDWAMAGVKEWVHKDSGMVNKRSKSSY
jgi:Protein HRI1